MATASITVPEHLEMRITRLVEQDEFADREEAIEELLSTGIRAFRTGGSMDTNDPDYEDDGMMGHEDKYVF